MWSLESGGDLPEVSFQSASLSCTASRIDLRGSRLRRRVAAAGAAVYVAFPAVSIQCLPDKETPSESL